MGIKKELKGLHLHISQIFIIGSPLLAGMVSEFFIYIADSVIVGRLGTDYLAAMGIASVFSDILWCIVYPFSPGTQAIAAQRFGRQKLHPDNIEKATGAVFPNALLVALIAGVITLGLGAFSKKILILILDNPHLISLANSYINLVKWVMPLGGIFYAFYGFLSAINLTRPIMIATVGLGIINIAFDYVFVLGKWGFPAMGIQGAALATLFAMIFGTGYLAFFYLFSKKTKEHRYLFKWQNLNKHLMKNITQGALPIIGQLVIVLVVYLLYESIIARFGTVYLAVTHIVMTTFILKRTLVGGYAEGGSVLIGNQIGQGQYNEARHCAYAIESIAAVFGIILCILILLFPINIVKIFNNDIETIILGKWALRYFALFFLIDILGYPFEIIFTHNKWGK